jgi:hypothetical protein
MLDDMHDRTPVWLEPALSDMEVLARLKAASQHLRNAAVRSERMARQQARRIVYGELASPSQPDSSRRFKQGASAPRGTQGPRALLRQTLAVTPQHAGPPIEPVEHPLRCDIGRSVTLCAIGRRRWRTPGPGGPDAEEEFWIRYSRLASQPRRCLVLVCLHEWRPVGGPANTERKSRRSQSTLTE